MTAKQAVKARCLACYGRKCEDERCVLYGLAKTKGKLPDGKKAIRRYCAWCMHGTPVNECASPECGIYRYRSERHTGMHIDFKPV